MLLRQTTLLLALFIGFAGSIFAQCPNCTINLPPMPVDTVYLDTFPDATQNQYYEEQISFRLPMTTTPLAVLQPGVPSGISLSAFQVLGISGLPLGMSFILDRPLPAVYDETAPDTRDGCVTICGTPLQSGTFTVNISVLVETGILAPESAIIPLTFIVQPDTSASFSVDVSNGCSPLEVNITNNINPDTSFGQTATHSWDFGNGQTSTDENPTTVTYNNPGIYNIEHQAVVITTTNQIFLSSVVVNQAGCGDTFGNPEIFITVAGAQSGIDTVTGGGPTNVPTAALPVTFNFGTSISLVPGQLYSIFVQEDDSQNLFGTIITSYEDCGTIYFTSDTSASSFSLTDGPLTVSVTLTYNTLLTYDTINTTAFIVVDNCSSIEELEELVSAFNIFPNPTKGQVQVQFDAEQLQNQDISLRLTDVLGRVVFQRELGQFQGQYNETHDLSAFGSGIYTMQLMIGNKMMYRRIVVE